MKAQVLYDLAGNVLCMIHSGTAETSGPQSPRLPHVRFKPTESQRAATFEIPHEVRNLAGAKLHASLRVELKEEEARLITRKA